MSGKNERCPLTQSCINACLYNNKTCHLPFPSSLLLEGYYYSGVSGPGSLGEAFLQQDHRFVTDTVTKDVLNEASTRAALSSELGYALEYSVEGATPIDEPGAKSWTLSVPFGHAVCSDNTAQGKRWQKAEMDDLFLLSLFPELWCPAATVTSPQLCTCPALILVYSTIISHINWWTRYKS